MPTRKSLLTTVAAAAALLVTSLPPAPAWAQQPPEGVPLDVRRGFFTETDIGVFWTLGGEDDYSNAQTYLQLGVGYDLTRSISLGVHFGLGSSAANCFAGLDANGECLATSNFTVAFGNATAAYNVPLGQRFFLTPKVTAGITRLDPQPTEPVAEGEESGTITALNAGAGVGFEYATHLEHFSIGADLLARYVLDAKIATFAIFPRVKFTF